LRAGAAEAPAVAGTVLLKEAVNLCHRAPEEPPAINRQAMEACQVSVQAVPTKFQVSSCLLVPLRRLEISESFQKAVELFLSTSTEALRPGLLFNVGPVVGGSNQASDLPR
jgi:hypothetical protein